MNQFHRFSDGSITEDSFARPFFTVRCWPTNAPDEVENRHDIHYHITNDQPPVYRPVLNGRDAGFEPPFGGLWGTNGHPVVWDPHYLSTTPGAEICAIEYRYDDPHGREQLDLLLGPGVSTNQRTYRTFPANPPHRPFGQGYRRRFCYKLLTSQLPVHYAIASELQIGTDAVNNPLHKQVLYPATENCSLDLFDGDFMDISKNDNLYGKAFMIPSLGALNWTPCCSLIIDMTQAELDVLLKGATGPRDPPHHPRGDRDLCDLLAALREMLDDLKDVDMATDCARISRTIKDAMLKTPDMTLCQLDGVLSRAQLRATLEILYELKMNGDPNEYTRYNKTYKIFKQLYSDWISKPQEADFGPLYPLVIWGDVMSGSLQPTDQIVCALELTRRGFGDLNLHKSGRLIPDSFDMVLFSVAQPNREFLRSQLPLSLTLPSGAVVRFTDVSCEFDTEDVEVGETRVGVGCSFKQPEDNAVLRLVPTDDRSKPPIEVTTTSALSDRVIGAPAHCAGVAAQCAGITKEGTRCRNGRIAPTPGFCRHHREQRGQFVEWCELYEKKRLLGVNAPPPYEWYREVRALMLERSMTLEQRLAALSRIN